MKQTQAFLSTYTADVSGVCSALFELGGMTVMHDASGCNSTYNTHDEPRWYDMDALVFISGLSELEAVLLFASLPADVLPDACWLSFPPHPANAPTANAIAAARAAIFFSFINLSPFVFRFFRL